MMQGKRIFYTLILIGWILFSPGAHGQQAPSIKTITVAEGWANNSVNTVIFRKNSLASFKDTQYIAYYSADQHVVIGRRRLGNSVWKLDTTRFTGDAADAHKSISIAIDGEGLLHMAWDQHNNSLRYVHSLRSGSIVLTDKLPMNGLMEQRVSYPEFYSLPDGDLLFLYRDGTSGNGNLVIKRYSLKTKQWTTVQQNLLNGEGQRSAYWQFCVDDKGVLHLSWVWRETADVASNHDLCYARSKDGGHTWERTDGIKYTLPITAATAEYAALIPQGSELINQTSMTTDEKGRPIIAGYWKGKDSVPQYQLVYFRDGWKTENLGFRKTAFRLNGLGTKQIPISRPQVVSMDRKGKTMVALVFRDEERGSRVNMALNNDLGKSKWKLSDLTNYSVGSWEPTFDTELWKQKKQLHLFVQQVQQVDGEGRAAIAPQVIKVLALIFGP
jgi:hypothetical protein